MTLSSSSLPSCFRKVLIYVKPTVRSRVTKLEITQTKNDFSERDLALKGLMEDFYSLECENEKKNGNQPCMLLLNMRCLTFVHYFFFPPFNGNQNVRSSALPLSVNFHPPAHVLENEKSNEITTKCQKYLIFKVFSTN